MRVIASVLCTLLGACARPALPPPVEPLVPTPDAAFRATRPDVSLEAASTDLPEVESAVLDNGLTVWVVPRPRLPLVTLRLVTRHAGPLESADPAELVELASRAIVEGGTTWVDGRIVEPLRIEGQPIAAENHPAYVTLGLTVSTRVLGWSIKVLAQTIRAPAWDAGNLDAARLSEVVSFKDRSSVSDLLLKTTASAAYGQEISALLPPLEPERVQEATVGDLRACYEHTFTPRASALIAVGDTRLEVVRALAERAFGSWRGAPAAEPLPPPKLLSEGRTIHFIPQPESSQARVLILQPAPTTGQTEDDLPFSLLAELALGGARARATDRLRHDRGLTYGIHPRIVRSRRLGLLAITAAIEPREVGTAVEELLRTLETLQRTPVSRQELNRAKLAFLGNFARSVGDDQALAQLLAGGFAEGREPRFLSEIREQLEAIGPEDLLRVARRYLRPKDAEIGVTGGFSLTRSLAPIGELSLYEVTKGP